MEITVVKNFNELFKMGKEDILCYMNDNKEWVEGRIPVPGTEAIDKFIRSGRVGYKKVK